MSPVGTELGISADKMIKDFQESQKTLAVYGKSGVKAVQIALKIFLLIGNSIPETKQLSVAQNHSAKPPIFPNYCFVSQNPRSSSKSRFFNMFLQNQGSNLSQSL